MKGVVGPSDRLRSRTTSAHLSEGNHIYMSHRAAARSIAESDDEDDDDETALLSSSEDRQSKKSERANPLSTALWTFLSFVGGFAVGAAVLLISAQSMSAPPPPPPPLPPPPPPMLTGNPPRIKIKPYANILNESIRWAKETVPHFECACARCTPLQWGVMTVVTI